MPGILSRTGQEHYHRLGRSLYSKIDKRNYKMPDGTDPPGIFGIQTHIYRTEVRQIGKCTARADERPSGHGSRPRSFVENHLFKRGGFGTFCDRYSPAFQVSCVLDKGGGTA